MAAQVVAEALKVLGENGGLAAGNGMSAEEAAARIADELADLAAGRATPARPTAMTVEVAPVLVVEDSATAAVLLEQAIRRLGLRNPVAVATTAEAAADHLRQSGPPALVLLDYELPDGRGLDLLARADARHLIGGAPVIMLSTHDGGSEIDEAYRLGVTAYLVKPVAFDAVEDVVRRLPVGWFIAADGDAAA